MTTQIITWIPVSAPPPEQTRCLLWAGGELKTGTYKASCSMEVWRDDISTCGDGGPYAQAVEGVTHWAHFPEGPKPTPVPLTPADVPPGSVVRNKVHNPAVWISVTGVNSTGAFIGSEGVHTTWEDLAEHWQILRPGGVWESANKTV